jgi:hypothetical protein
MPEDAMNCEPSLDDEDLVFAAEQIFLELERTEAADLPPGDESPG